MLRQIIFHPAFRIAAAAVLSVALIHLISAIFYDSNVQYREISVVVPEPCDDLEGYTAAFVTDIHGTPRKVLEEIAAELTARKIDLLLLGGDYSGQSDLSECLAVFAGIAAPDGVYGVEGNHDNAERLRRAMEQNGMALLENEGVHVREGLYVAGTEDLWNRKPDVEKALENAQDSDYILLLCHNPDTSMARDFSRVNLALSGHTHGGEVTLFGQWGPAMWLVSAYGQRFRSGWALTAAGTDIYVSNGVGKHSPIRVFAPPQVIILKFTADNS